LGWPDKDASPLQNTYTADPHSPHNLSPDQLQHILAVMDKGTLGYASLTLNSAFRQNMAGVFNRQDVLEVRLTHCIYMSSNIAAAFTCDQAQLPSVNGVTNARALAKIYSACIRPTDGAPQPPEF
jgi:hypothetical protein